MSESAKMNRNGEDEMSRLTGKIALVTGASKGIGAGIAKNLGAEGATVVVNYATSREGADRTVAEICYDSGFGNLSNFNRQFLKLRKVPPRAFRRKRFE